MTANPIRPARYRPGKPTAAEPPSDESEEGSDEEEQQQQKQSSAAAPKATSFPSTTASKITSNLKDVDLNARRKQAAEQEAARVEQEKAAQQAAEEGFETESSAEGSGTSGSKSEEEGSSEEEESSSEDDAPARRTLLRPVFLKRDARKPGATATPVKSEDEQAAEEAARRQAKADALVQEQLDKNAAARAAGKKFWDDEELGELDHVDDTDGLDPEAEYAAWKLRELRRVKREREALIAAEVEREEIERRRNLTAEEREAEDREFLERQKEEREGKGKMGFMQKYFHKGAFFQDDLKEKGLDKRDIMGSRYADDAVNRELLPQYMQIRDLTRLGRKGRTRYKDLKSEDTGRWGDLGDRRGPRGGGGGDSAVDDRFRPDARSGGAPTGADASAVGDRKRGADSDTREGKRARVD